jgi:hypothetical protein
MDTLPRLLSHPSPRRTISGTTIHIVVGILAVAAAAPPLWPVSRAQTAGAAIQLARGAARVQRSSRQTVTSDDRGADLDKPLPASKPVRVGSGFTTGAGGYSQQRVRRFWSHYHRARPGPKEKPLEGSSRDSNK